MALSPVEIVSIPISYYGVILAATVTLQRRVRLPQILLRSPLWREIITISGNIFRTYLHFKIWVVSLIILNGSFNFFCEERRTYVKVD